MSKPQPNQVSRKVLEAYTRDVGRGVARIDYDAMDALKASTGAVIVIEGKRRTVAKLLPLYPSDEGRDIIRMDGLIRNNAGTSLGDTVKIQPTESPPASVIRITPTEAIPPIDERYLAEALESVPVMKGDNLMVPYFGGRLTFQVISTVPSAPSVTVTRETNFQITEQKKGGAIEINKVEDLADLTASIAFGDKKLNLTTETIEGVLVLDVKYHEWAAQYNFEITLRKTADGTYGPSANAIQKEVDTALDQIKKRIASAVQEAGTITVGISDISSFLVQAVKNSVSKSTRSH